MWKGSLVEMNPLRVITLQFPSALQSLSLLLFCHLLLFHYCHVAIFQETFQSLGQTKGKTWIIEWRNITNANFHTGALNGTIKQLASNHALVSMEMPSRCSWFLFSIKMANNFKRGFAIRAEVSTVLVRTATEATCILIYGKNISKQQRWKQLLDIWQSDSNWWYFIIIT